MAAMDFPNSPTNGQTTTDGRYYFDSSVGSAGAWRSTPLPVGGLPAGSIMAWGTNTPPANWLLADGSAISRDTYSSLFAVIGTQYGAGNGTSTFNLPDLRGRVPVGRNSGTFGTLGATGGAETVTLDVTQIPSHTHGPGNENSFITSNGGTVGVLPSGASNFNPYNRSSTTAATGGGLPHNNLQPYQVVNYIIKTSAGWTAGDSELATRIGALETADATTNKSGLVPIVPSSIVVNSGTSSVSSDGTVSFSGAGTVSVNNSFSGSYKFYRVVIPDVLPSASIDFGIRLRASGTDSSASYFYGALRMNAAGTSQAYNGNNVGVQNLARLQISETQGGMTLDILNPFETKTTKIMSNAMGHDSAWPTSYTGIGWHNVASSYDGFTLTSTSGTMAGSFKIYGYR